MCLQEIDPELDEDARPARKNSINFSPPSPPPPPPFASVSTDSNLLMELAAGDSACSPLLPLVASPTTTHTHMASLTILPSVFTDNPCSHVSGLLLLLFSMQIIV